MSFRIPYRWPKPLEELSDSELQNLWIDITYQIEAERRRRDEVRQREFREFHEGMIKHGRGVA